VATLSAQAVRHIDVENLFPSVGSAIIWVEPNDAGVPPGVLAAGSGVLIGDRVFLTAAHVTRPSRGWHPTVRSCLRDVQSTRFRSALRASQSTRFRCLFPLAPGAPPGMAPFNPAVSQQCL